MVTITPSLNLRELISTKGRRLLLAGLAAAVVACISSMSVHAITYIGPDPNEYGSASDSVRLALSNTSSTPGIYSLRLPVYLDMPYSATPPTATLCAYMLQNESGAYVRLNDGAGGSGYSGIWSSSGSTDCPGTKNNGHTYVMQNFTWDEDNQLWVSTLTAQLMHKDKKGNFVETDSSTSKGDLLEFRVKVIASSPASTDITKTAIIGYTASTSDLFATDTVYGGEGFSDYSLQFATPCNITEVTGVRDIGLYDLDSGNADNNGGTITISVKDEVSGIRYTQGSTFSDTRRTFDDHGTSRGQRSTYLIGMRYYPGHRYILNIGNVYKWNVLQYRFPFDNIAYKHGCPSYNVTATTNMTVDSNGVKTAGLNSSNSGISNPTKVHVGDVITWSHTLNYTSPYVMTRSVGYWFTCSVNATTLAQGTKTNPAGRITDFRKGVKETANVADPTSGNCASPYTIQASDAGKRFCHRLDFFAKNEQGDSGNSAEVCVRVVPDGQLSPQLDVTPDGMVENNDIAEGVFSIDNDAAFGTNANSTARIWYDVNKNGVFDAGDRSVFFSVTPATAVGAKSTVIVHDQSVTADRSLGPRICFSWQLNSASTPGLFVDTDPIIKCLAIGKSPKVQVWGNDVRVGSGFVTGSNANSSIKSVLSHTTGGFRGSWGEYGVIAPGNITNFSSGSGLNALAPTNIASTWSNLTFANTGLTGTMGNYAPASSLGGIPDVKTYLTNAAAKAGLNLQKISGSLTINNYKANWVYIVGGTVTIQNDIINNSPPNGVSTLSQMVIIANDIDISSSVHQIDAWLITPEGTINTCVLPGGDQRLSTSVCDQALRINGPLMADTILPRRTAGDSQNAGEIYDLRGDAYIWARKVSEANGSVHTTYLRELPPRY